MDRFSMVAAGMMLALAACEPRAADRPDQTETGATPSVTDTAAGAPTTGAAGEDTTTAPPGYAGMERDTAAAGTDTGQAGKMDSFRLQQETGSDTGGHSGGEQVKPSKDTAH